jgi:hypothetical protein
MNSCISGPCTDVGLYTMVKEQLNNFDMTLISG